MATEDFEAHAVRAARRVSEASIVCTTLGSTAAVALGVDASSAALVAFGAVGYVDLVGSVALVHHFRHALRHDALSDHFEQRAHRVVTVGLFSVGVVTVIAGGVRLAIGSSADTAIGGIVVASVSLVALGALSARKAVVAARVRSAALRADGHLSSVGAAQALVVLVGTVATRVLSWHWADNVAALVVGSVALGLATVSWARVRTVP